MSKQLNQHNLFKPARSKSEAKADVTDRAAQAIIDSEAAKRREKTERLKAQRLSVEENSENQNA